MNYYLDKKQLSGEQKLGKYDITRSFFSLIGTLLFIAIQLSIIYLICKYETIRTVFFIVQFVTLLHVVIFSRINKYKLAWFIIILLFPLLGALLYFLGGNNCRLSRSKKNKPNNKILKDIKSEKVEELEKIKSYTDYPIYKNQGIEYFGFGEEFFRDLEIELKKAKEYIFIQIYILEKGILFENILKILEEKARSKVKVEIIADSAGSILKIPHEYKLRMKNAGITFKKYKPLKFSISNYFLYRDHKKIILIDGKVAYIGGINITDEYVNDKELYGFWKDGGIKLYGDVVFSYLHMYLKCKQEVNNQNVSYENYFLKNSSIEKKVGFHLAYDDGMEKNQNAIQNTLVEVINNTKNYLYITVPYFIPNEFIVTSVINAASRGVDVRLLVPHIPDKNIVLFANRSFYKKLLEGGVKVYEYKLGFIHSKYIVADDIAIIGTANLDYKSIYFNKECMNLSFKTGIERKIKSDFEETLKKSILIEKEEWKKRNCIEKIKESIAHFLSPLL